MDVGKEGQRWRGPCGSLQEGRGSGCMWVLGKQVTWSSKHTLHTHPVTCSHPRAPLKFPHNPTFSHIHTLTHYTLSDTPSTPQILIQSHMISCAHTFTHTHTNHTDSQHTLTHTNSHTPSHIHTHSHTHTLKFSQLHNLTFMHS